MSTTFLRLTLARPEGEAFLINADHIVRVHQTWPNGCVIVTSDNASLNVTAPLAELQKRLCMTGGRTHVVKVDTSDEPHKYENEHQVDAAATDVFPNFYTPRSEPSL